MGTTRSWLLTIIPGVALFALGCEAALGPSCTTNEECFTNAVCEGDECQCATEYVISGNWTICLPKIALPYSSECDESPQCTARMGKGAVCSEGICVCSEGYHYLHGLCYRSVGYGDYCYDEDDCSGSYSYEALYCDESSICSCAPGFELVKESYGICRRVGYAVGEECFFDIDCKTANTVCDAVNGVCIENSSSRKLLENDVIDSPRKRSVAVMEVGANCRDSSDCSQTEMECLLGTCVCKAGYYAEETACLRELGESCNGAVDCEHISGAICDENKCRCKMPSISTDNNRACYAGRKYNIRCQVNEQCQFYGDHASCLSDGQYSECMCKPGYHLVEEVQLCVEDLAIGQDCVNSFDCTAENSICEGTCQCQDGFHANGIACVKNVDHLGDACLTNDDCSGLPYSTCTNNVCTCPAGYFPNNDSTSCLTGVSGNCDETAECLADLSECVESKCVCTNETISNAAYSKCLAVGVYGSTCEETVQCTGSLGEDGGVCVDGVCGCTDDYHYRNEYCWEVRYVGDACEYNSQCYINSGHMDRVSCLSGNCQCGYAFEQTGDLDCRAGVGRMDASAMMIVLSLVMALLVVRNQSHA